MGQTVWVTPHELQLFRNLRHVIGASDHNKDGHSDSGILQNACDAANKFVDGYLGLADPGLPIDKVTPALKMLAAYIALKLVFDGTGITDEVAQRNYDDAFVKLKEIISIPVAVAEVETVAGPIDGNKTECDLDADLDGMANVIPERNYRRTCG